MSLSLSGHHLAFSFEEVSMKKRQRNRKKTKCHHRLIKYLVFPQTEAEIPAFEDAIMDCLMEAHKSPDGRVEMCFLFPGRSQAEAERIGVEWSRIFERNFTELREKWGI